MIIYENAKYIKVVYLPEKNYIVFDWVDFLIPLADIKELHEKALTAAQQNQCYYYMAQTAKVTTVLSSEIIKWWADEWVPKLIAAGIRAIVTVVPSTAIAAMSTHSWQAQVIGSITMMNAKSIDDAEAIIKQLQANHSV